MKSQTAVVNPGDILTPEELCARLKVRKTWIYEKLRDKKRNPLPVLKMGRYLRFHWPDVAAWLLAQQRGKAAR